MKKLALFLSCLALSLPAFASTDGEVAWTKFSFCNGAGYCVDAESMNGVGVSVLRITHNGREMKIPKDAIAIEDVDAPLFNEARLLSVQREDGNFGNILEIPYLKFTDGKSKRDILRLHFDPGDLFEKSESRDGGG